MENRPTQTAVGPMVIVAIDQGEEHPLIHDELAHRILPAGMRTLVALTRPRPVRRWMAGAMEKKAPGMWASFLCRKRYIDDKLLEAVEAGIDATVILGAGLDTRAYRLPALAKTPVYEVDLPDNIKRKRTLLHKLYGKVPDGVTLVPVDFETQDLGSALVAQGYDNGAKTFFVWEAVTQYLTEDGVRKTFDFLATAHPGSGLVFTHLRKDFLDGTAFYGAEALHQQYKVKRRLWHFGLNPEHIAAFLAEYGWRDVEQPSPQEFTTRYVQPAGRNLPVSEVERSVYAEKI
ncbi:SAM-dependent methyltransferase [Streptomyces phaeochromogenes]|uniref:SAM-dependent methyltransferase n=1 Tax=Streptomyces phaeochromogenes TaxID=1923 RepID=UPI00386EBEA9|nr:SAM-dependent methyltransferase [Streptomyces phaeochromogenes]